MNFQKIDYLTVSCDNCTTDRILFAFDRIPKQENLLRISKNEDATEEELQKLGAFKRISNHYRNHFHWFYGGAIATDLYANQESENQMLINISGTGMEVLRGFGYTDLEIFQKFEELGFSATRIDFSLDFHNQEDWKEIAQALKENRYITRTKSMNCIYDPITREVETIYIGSQKNREILLCLYDKRKEQNKKIVERNKREKRHDKLIQTPWYRIEMRLYNGSKNKVCAEMFQRLLKEAQNENDVYNLCRKKALKFFRFIERGELDGKEFSRKDNAWGTYDQYNKFKRIKNVQRLKIAKFWSRLLGENTLSSQPRELINNHDQYVDCFNIQSSKRFIKRLMVTLTPEQRQELINVKDPDDKKLVLAFHASQNLDVFLDLFDYGIENWKQEDQDFVDQVLIPALKKAKTPHPHKKEI